MYLLYCAEKFRLDLMNIVRTTLSSKILLQNKEHFAKLAVDAVMKLKVGDIVERGICEAFKVKPAVLLIYNRGS
ncbi:T-complex protein 1 subunit beta [Trifolium repens]|nr:T-complex protein 1 subunit beta [Trifolium repens]